MRFRGVWLLVPLGVFAVATAVGWTAAAKGSSWAARAAALSPQERGSAEAAVFSVVANATWTLGSVDAVKEMARFEIERLPAAEGEKRARVFMRFGIVDTNPDGQAALFHQACAADERICERLKEAAEREVRERFVAPGNLLPLYFGAGHPHAP